MKRLLTALLTFALSLSAGAQALPALLVPADARSLALGGADLIKERGVSSAGAYYGLWARSCNVVGGEACVYVGERLVIEASVSDFLDKAYDIYNEQGTPSGHFAPYDLVIGLGASYHISDRLSAGAVVKSVTSGIAEGVTGNAYCVDVHTSWSGTTWSAGLALRNLGTAINYGSGDYALPSLAALYGNWRPLASLTLAAEADCLFSGAFMAGMGAEYGFADVAFVRAGYHYGTGRALPSFASAGAGCKFGGFRLDAAVLLLSDTLGGSFMLRAGYSF